MPDNPETIDYKGQVVGRVLGCEIRVVTAADGKRHFESDCLSKEARDELAAVFEEEAILRIAPKAFLEEIAEPEPTEPIAEPIQMTMPAFKVMAPVAKGYGLTWLVPEVFAVDPVILTKQGQGEVYRWEYIPTMGEVWDKIRELERLI